MVSVGDIVRHRETGAVFVVKYEIGDGIGKAYAGENKLFFPANHLTQVDHGI